MCFSVLTSLSLIDYCVCVCVPGQFYLANFTYDPEDKQSVAISKHLFGTLKNLSFFGLSVSAL